MAKKSVTRKALLAFLKKEGKITDLDSVTGTDGDFKSSLGPWIDFIKIFGRKRMAQASTQEMVEAIIRWKTVFGEGNHDFVNERIKKHYGGILSEEEQKKIARLRYSKWGRLSRKLLTGIHADVEGVGSKLSLIEAMRLSTMNLMELLSARFAFAKAIQQVNVGEETSGEISYKMVADLHTSPSVKRMLWQALLVVGELREVLQKDPKKIFVEVGRSKEDLPERKMSRKKSLEKLYKEIKGQSKEEKDAWNELLSRYDDRQYQRKKLYHYFLQKGRCMYTGERIDINALFSNHLYDIDHIFPQSKIKDDSITNTVLVTRQANAEKSDRFPLPMDIQSRQMGFWNELRKQKFLSEAKFERLTRKTALSNDELANFIARQMVETHQASKLAIQFLKQLFPHTDVVYSKARNVSDFRHEFELLKIRSLNNLHHAHDAYLNIVVGNAYHVKFTSNPWNFISGRGEQRQYHMQKIFKYPIERDGITAWIPGENQSLKTVRKVLASSRVLTTMRTAKYMGGFYDQQPLKKGKGQISRKENEGLTDIQKYGGYSKAKSSYFILVEHGAKKRKRSLETVTVQMAYRLAGKTAKCQKEMLDEYCRESLNLQKPSILIDQIKINSLFSFDGFPVRLTGRSPAVYWALPQVNLLLSKELSAVLRTLENPLYDYDRLSDPMKEKLNLQMNRLYRCFLTKSRHSIYAKRPNIDSVVKVMEESEEEFVLWGLSKKASVLRELYKVFRVLNETCDLKAIGGVEFAAKSSIGKTISSRRMAVWINQSPTGLFENRTDLLGDDLENRTR